MGNISKKDITQEQEQQPQTPEASSRPVRRPDASQKKKHKKRWVWRIFRHLFAIMMLCALAGGAGVLSAYRHFSRGLPELHSLADYRPSLVTRVFARDYRLLGEFFFQRRQFIPMDEVPQVLIHAFLAIEDSKYYQHPGIDLVGIFRAAYANLRAGRVVQGASTITQQVAKTFLLTSVRSVERKVREIILALRIEQQFTKGEILELYVNQIYMGAGAYGVGAASHIYFNRDVSELTLEQMALLAALPKAPSYYSPWRFPKRAKKRQKLVLNRMVEVGYLTQAEADTAAEKPLGLVRPHEPLEMVAPHYLEHVRRTILGNWGEWQLYRGGLDVYTALDPEMQRVAQEAVRRGLVAYDRRHGYRGVLEHLENSHLPEVRQSWQKVYREGKVSVSNYVPGLVFEVGLRHAQVLLLDGQEVRLTLEGVEWARRRLDKEEHSKKRTGPAIETVQEVLSAGDVILVDPPRDKRKFFELAQEPDAEAALVSLDPHTGQVLAMVGGYNYGDSQFNRATQGVRQPGSSFKPFVYAAALESTLTPVSQIDDSPLPISYTDLNTGKRKKWRAQNYEKKFYGPTTLRVGLVHSRNLVTIRLLKRIGIPYVVDFMRRLDFEIPPFRQDLSLALGSLGFTPLKMASGYAVFANGGKLIEPVYITRVQDRFGRTVHRHRGGDCLLCHQEVVQKEMEEEGEVMSLFGKPVLDPATAYQVTNLMKGVITHGTGRKAAKLRRPLAGKTGTTNDLRDAWFVGFSPSLVTAVWVGMDDNTPLGYRETGGKAALPIWTDYMGKVLEGVPRTDFSVPKGIVLERIDAETGLTASEDTKLWVMEAFKLGQKPRLGTTQKIEEGFY